MLTTYICVALSVISFGKSRTNSYGIIVSYRRTIKCKQNMYTAYTPRCYNELYVILPITKAISILSLYF